MGKTKLFILIIGMFVLLNSLCLTFALSDLNQSGTIEDLIMAKNKNLLKGDVTDDYKVNIFDLSSIGFTYGQDNSSQEFQNSSDNDINKDGKVSIMDLAVVGMNYGSVAFTESNPSPAHISIEPSSKEINETDNFTMTIIINTTENIFAAEVTILFNNQILNATKITEGDFLKQDGANTFCSNDINNAVGTLSFSCTRFNVPVGVTGTGILFSVNFTGIGGGQTVLDLQNITLVDENLDKITGISTSNGSVYVFPLNHAPESPILISPLNNSLINESMPTFNWTFADQDMGDLQHAFQIQIANSTNFDNFVYDTGQIISNLSSYKSSFQIDDGKWYWRARTKDNRTWSNYSIPFVLSIDTLIPNIILNSIEGSNNYVFSPNNDGFYDSVTIRMNASENVDFEWTRIINSSGDTIKYFIGPSNSTFANKTWDGTLTEGGIAIDGVYNITTKITDMAGNVNNSIFLGAIEIDNTPPQIFGETKTPQPSYNDNNVELNATITDRNLGLVWMSGNWEGSWKNYKDVSNQSSIYSFIVNAGNFSNQEVVSWIYYAKDSVENFVAGTLQMFIVYNRPPTKPTLLTIEPLTAFKTSLLTANASGSTDADNDALTYYYEFRDSDNSTILQAFSLNNNYNCSADLRCTKHDLIYIHSKAYDSYNFSEETTNTKEISNSPPSIPASLTLSPSIIYVGNTLTATASGSTDADNDALTYYYEFYNVNDSTIKKAYSTSNTYSIQVSDAHDLIRVRTKAYDSENYSLENESRISVSNTPPTTPPSLILSPSIIYVGNTLTATASGSTDADNDAISYYYEFYNVNSSLVLQSYSTTNIYTIQVSDAHNLIRVRAKAFDGTNYSASYIESSKPVRNSIPTTPINLELSPSIIYVGNTLIATASGSTDADNDNIIYYYEFYNVNDSTIKKAYSTSNTYTIQVSDAHNLIRVRAKAFDGTNYSASYIESTEPISNSVPTIPTTLTLSPNVIYVNSNLTATASGSTDADNDALTYYYKFYDLNNSLILQDYSTNNKYTITQISAHHLINVSAKAYDNTNYSDEKINNKLVNNSAPVANADGPYNGTEGSVIILNASKSYDIDNDVLNYEWDLDNDGLYDDAIGITPQNSWPDDYYGVIRVKASDDATFNTSNSIVNITNVPPAVISPQNIIGDEGSQVTLGSIIFTDPGVLDTFTAKIKWGDGNITNLGSVTSPISQQNHVYSKDGIYIITINVTDDDKGVGTANVTANIANVPPSFISVDVISPIDEGSMTNLTSTVFDPGSDDTNLTYEIEWGDGSAHTKSSTSNWRISSFHKYLDNGDYTITLTITDSDLAKTTNTINVIVNNVAPVANANGPYNCNEGGTMQLTGSETDAGILDTHTFAWDLDNDDVYETPGQNVNFICTSDGIYDISVQVKDNDNGIGEAKTNVNVNNVAPSITFINVTSPVGTGFEAILDFSAFDPGNDDATLSYEIDWGDATKTTETIPVNQMASKGHVYLNSNNYIITLKVTDSDGAFTQSTINIIVMQAITVSIPSGVSIFSLPLKPLSPLSFNLLNSNCDVASDGPNSQCTGSDLAYYDAASSSYVCIGLDELLYPGQGYFIKVNNACSFTIIGNSFGLEEIGYLGTKQIKKGWNTIGSPTISTAFSRGTCTKTIVGPLIFADGVSSCDGIGSQYKCDVGSSGPYCYCETANLNQGEGYYFYTAMNCSLS